LVKKSISKNKNSLKSNPAKKPKQFLQKIVSKIQAKNSKQFIAPKNQDNKKEEQLYKQY